MAGTYTEAHRKYFQKHKEEIYERNREYKRKYNREWYLKNKSRVQKEITDRNRTEIRMSLFKAVQDSFQDTTKTGRKTDFSETS
jgi:hypothetical protein